ncbi:hypothetical protein K457DRAFT_890177 [Linnemannia elongata AG-77]|uniref:F-box domain-containing protein n=1 Tax=Linnemannia elongata AG-77 TaxID=1314771 RepID=A0A197K3H3_9FUNG|nr:hypothetical protein K457DRAFT_890177 [Linnemannia elongata AG-77]
MTINKLISENNVLRSLHPYLAKSDLQHLALVNKLWNTAFQPFLWRNLSFSHGTRYLTLFDNSDEYAKVILKNAAYIECFYFRGCANPATLLLFFSSCRNFRSFECHLQYELPQDVFACLNIVEQNQGLVSFFIDGIPIKRLGVAQKFLQVLSQHTGLRRLEFKSADSKISEHLFKAILQSVPPTLHTLDLKWSIEIQDDNDFEFRDEHVALPGWTNNGIKTLELNKALTGYEQSVAFPFLRHCVRLDNFRSPPQLPIKCGPVLTRILREYCPLFSRVLISNQDHDSVIASVVNGSRALNEFRVRYYGSVGSELTLALVAQAAHLHTIEIEDGIFVRSGDIQMMLSHCSGLKTFMVEDWQEDGHESLLEIKDMVSSPWVCLGLRDLTLPIGSDYGVHTDEQDEEWGQRRQDMITKAYRQLGALTELRTLSFGSQVPQENSAQFPLDAEGKNDFDLTLASGLDHLKDLKMLWRLDVAGLRHRMRETELHWIEANWPNLRDFRGIYMYEGDELSEDEEMEEDSEEEDDEDKGVAGEEEADTGDQLEGDEPEPEPEPEPEGKMTRRHVSWFLGKRPYAELC